MQGPYAALLADASAAIGNGIRLKEQALFSPGVGKVGFKGFADGVLSVKALLDDFLHDGDVPHVPEQAIHLHHMFQGKACLLYTSRCV